MAGGWEVMDISGDAGIRAQGQDCKEAFENASYGMYSLVTDLGSVDEKISKQIRVSASSMDSLLVDFLNELIFM
ncbi:MAG: archease, partial [Nitrospiraceae bacterium]|nr:archease [Nitrospiraceae bacterium]